MLNNSCITYLGKYAAVLAIVFFTMFSFSSVYAQMRPIAGDQQCGSSATTECNANHLTALVKGVTFLIFAIGLPLLVVIISARLIMAWFQRESGNANAYKEALKQTGKSLVGFLIILAVVGGLLTTLLTYLGASSSMTTFLKLLSDLGFVQVAYAQNMLTSPVNEGIDIYDLILNLVSLVMRFFVYPGLIIVWVWTGFAFVAAQGKPEALNKAKKLLIGAVISTFVIVTVQGFLFAAKGTVEQVLPGSTQGQDASASQPEPTGACTKDGISGRLEADGVTCNTASRAGSRAADPTFCNGKAPGTLCALTNPTDIVTTGICKKDVVTSCFRASSGEACILANGTRGSMTIRGECFVTPNTRADGVMPGGSCRISAECNSNICYPYDNTCYKAGDPCVKSDGRKFGNITARATCE